MGLLDRWFKRKAQTQLQTQRALEAGKPAAVASAPPVAPSAAPLAGEAAARPISRRTTQVIVRPLITEKATVGEGRGQYAFLVAGSASKSEIARAVEELYGVRPAAVRVMHQLGKTVRFGRTLGRRGDTKKALVSLPAGATLSLHEGV